MLRRWPYEDACGIAHALNLVGDRWTLLVVRELILGPREFCALRAGLPGISNHVLHERLDHLAIVGVLRKCGGSSAESTLYELTPWGYELEQAIVSLGRWAHRSPSHNLDLPLSAVSLMISLRAWFDARAAAENNILASLIVGAEHFSVHIAEGAVEICRGAVGHATADFRMTAGPQIIAAAVYFAVPFEDLESIGALTLEGDRDAAKTFVGLFRLPKKRSGAVRTGHASE